MTRRSPRRARTQVYAATWLMLGALQLQLLLRPWSDPLFNGLETLSIAASFLTQKLSVLYWVDASLEADVTHALIALNGATFAAFALAFIYKLDLPRRLGPAIGRARRRRRGGGGGDERAREKQQQRASLTGVEIELAVRRQVSIDSGLPEPTSGKLE